MGLETDTFLKCNTKLSIYDHLERATGNLSCVLSLFSTFKECLSVELVDSVTKTDKK